MKLENLLSALLGGLIAGFSLFAATCWQGQNNLALEKKKLESQLIIQAVATGNEEQAVKNLSFLLNAGLIKDDDGKIANIIKEDPESVIILPQQPEFRLREMQHVYFGAITEFKIVSRNHLLGYCKEVFGADWKLLKIDQKKELSSNMVCANDGKHEVINPIELCKHLLGESASTSWGDINNYNTWTCTSPSRI